MKTTISASNVGFSVSATKLKRNPIEGFKHVLFVNLLLVAITSHGQNKLLVKTYFKSNKAYKTTFHTYTNSEINYAGKKDVIYNMGVKDIKKPIRFSTMNDMTLVERTGEYSAKGELPVTITYGKVISTKKLNDKETQGEELYSDLIIEGSYTKRGRLQIDSMISDKLDKTAQAALKTTLESLEQKIKFPKYALSIGDGFDQDLPIQIPLIGLHPVSVVLNNNYTLIAMEDGKAIFKVVQTVTSGVSFTEDGNAFVTGKGTGICEYDIEENTITGFESNLSMTLKIVGPGLLVGATVIAQAEQRTTIEDSSGIPALTFDNTTQLSGSNN